LKSRQSQQSEFWGAGSRLSIRDFGCRVAAQHMRFEVPGRVSLSFRRFGVPGRVSLSTRRFGVPGRVSALEIGVPGRVSLSTRDLGCGFASASVLGDLGCRFASFAALEIWGTGSRQSQHSEIYLLGSKD